MFLIRQSKPKDAGTLVKLARMVYFISLPPNEQIITDKTLHSARSFAKAAGAAPEARPARPRKNAGILGLSVQDADLFMFTMEDLDSGGVIGTSQVKAHMGGPGNPNWSMKLGEKKFFSPELGQGTTHTTAKLYADETGPSELGGLILAPSHRGHRLRPGRFLSYVRFHVIGLHRAMFADRVIAEMMGPVSGEGDSQFWDYFGRKFIPVKYAEADRFCQHNRSFISELLPKEEIYITLFPLEIQSLVGAVNREALPARRMLESLGFRFRGFVDPFDAGPHLEAATDAISLVRDTRSLRLGKPVAPEKCDAFGIVSTLSPEGEFRAVECPCVARDGAVRVPEPVYRALGQDAGARAGFTPTPAPLPQPTAPGASKPRSTRKRVKA